MKKKRKRICSRSLGHRQVEKVLQKLSLKVVNEFKIEKFPYDMYIPKLNLIIEYYGDRWHYHKSKYPPDFYDKVKNQYVWEKWKKDEYKRNMAKNAGYSVEVIWECEWKKLSNRKRFIEKMVNKYEERID